LSDSFPILSPLLFNFALGDAISKIQENQVGLNLLGTHQLLAYADVNLLEIIRKSQMSRHQNAGQNWGIKIAIRSFENVSQFKYFGTTVTNQNFI
jgi:hypothetical protein